jgi:hypothetical protein
LEFLQIAFVHLVTLVFTYFPAAAIVQMYISVHVILQPQFFFLFNARLLGAKKEEEEQ